LQQRAAGLLLWARRVGDTAIDRGGCSHTAHGSTAFGSKREQCHVYSQATRLNTDLFCFKVL